MATIYIEQNVPVPPVVRPNNLKPRQDQYPWKVMNVGDSFLLPPHIKHGSSLVTGASKRNGRKFICRKTPQGHRVWRTA